MNRYARLFRHIATLALLALGSLLLVSPSYADSDDSGSFAKRVAGSYFIQQAVSPTSQRILTLTSDRTWFSIATEQPVFGFTDQQGTWKRTGPREITARVLDFDFGSPDGPRVAEGIYVVSFSNNFRNITGVVQVVVFPVGADPLDPDQEPEDVFSPDTFEGQRIEVEGGDDDDSDSDSD